MSDDRSRRAERGAADEAGQGVRPPDLAPLRAVAEREEIADAIGRLAGSFGGPLRDGDPLKPLASAVARALIEAGFTVHHCARHHPLYRLGGVCLLPVAGGPGPDDGAGIVVSWTSHRLLALDWDRSQECQDMQAVMNWTLAEVVEALGFQARPFGPGGAWMVTGRKSDCQEAAQ